MDDVKDEGSTSESCKEGPSTDEAVAMVARGPAMVDSGAGKHLTSKRRCSAKEMMSATPNSEHHVEVIR